MSLRIGITQRVEEVAAYGERRDCLDQQWFVLLEQLGMVPVPIPNSLENTAAWVDAMALDGFIFSGGNDLAQLPNPSRPAPERDATEAAVLAHAREQSLPVLGVCRGLQMMNTWLGGHLVPVKGHVATRHSVTALGENPLFFPYIEVNSFHDWAIPAAGVAEALQPCIQTAEGGIEAVTHWSQPWIGIMWHPERETPFTKADITLITQLFKGDT